MPDFFNNLKRYKAYRESKQNIKYVTHFHNISFMCFLLQNIHSKLHLRHMQIHMHESM
jgi:hypothetical protein